MTELSRAQMQAWETSLQAASRALDEPSGGPARLRDRLRLTASALRESVESVRRLIATLAGLRGQLLADQERAALMLTRLPIPYLETTADGTILSANQAAGDALNLSVRGLTGRNLLLFLSEREEWMDVLTQTAASDTVSRRVAKLRPRERLQTSVLAHLCAVQGTHGPAILWFLTIPPTPAETLPRVRGSSVRPHATPSSPAAS